MGDDLYVNRLVLWCRAVRRKFFELNEGGIPGMTGCDGTGRAGLGWAGPGGGCWGRGPGRSWGQRAGIPGELGRSMSPNTAFRQ